MIGEISLPPQTHRITYLTLNAIERHFYTEQHKAGASVLTLTYRDLCTLGRIESGGGGLKDETLSHVQKNRAYWHVMGLMLVF